MALPVPAARRRPSREPQFRGVGTYRIVAPTFESQLQGDLRAQTADPRPLDDRHVAEYAREGFVIARGFFGADEIDLLRRAAKQDRELDAHAFGRADGEGGTVRLSLWNHPGDGIYGMFARCERIVRSAERLLDGEVYHYHSKMIMKDARVGGAWTWHQD